MGQLLTKPHQEKVTPSSYQLAESTTAATTNTGQAESPVLQNRTASVVKKKAIFQGTEP